MDSLAGPLGLGFATPFRHPQLSFSHVRAIVVRALLVTATVVALTGCAADGVLAKPGGTTTEFQRDHAACVSWMYGVSTPRGRSAVRWTYYDWCMRERGYRHDG